RQAAEEVAAVRLRNEGHEPLRSAPQRDFRGAERYTAGGGDGAGDRAAFDEGEVDRRTGRNRRAGSEVALPGDAGKIGVELIDLRAAEIGHQAVAPGRQTPDLVSAVQT